MSLRIKSSVKESEFKSVEPGNYLGQIINIIDCGTQRFEYMGEVKNLPKLYLRFELNEYMEDERPYIIGGFYTASMHEKATLRQLLEGARGKKFTDEEAADFDMFQLLGKNCLVNVVSTEKNGKTYTNVQALTKTPKGYNVPPVVNPLVYFDIDAPDMAVFESLPKFLKEKIESSSEWKLRGKQPDVPAKPVTTAAPADDDQSDIPF
jgi:hypothetical protein